MDKLTDKVMDKVMDKYECNLCSKQFLTKGNYLQHLQRLTLCNNVNNLEKCQYCNKSFRNKYNRLRHESSVCQERIKQEEKQIQDTRMKEMEEKNKKLEEKLLELEVMVKNGINPLTTNNSNNTNSNNTTTILQNNTFVLNKYGYEDLSHISENKMIHIFRNCFLSVPTFIKMKHFSTDKPENHNVYIADIKSQYALIYNGVKWMITDKKQLLHDMYDENCDYLVCEYKERKSQLDKTTLETFNKFINSKDDDHIMNTVKENIKQMLYNEKDMALEVRKK